MHFFEKFPLHFVINNFNLNSAAVFSIKIFEITIISRPCLVSRYLF